MNLLLGYGPETAGRIMTPKYIRLTQEMTVAQALEKVRTQAVSPETLHTLYVTDAERCLVGWLPLQALILNSPATPIVEIMNPDVAWVTTDTDQEETAQRLLAVSSGKAGVAAGRIGARLGQPTLARSPAALHPAWEARIGRIERWARRAEA